MHELQQPLDFSTYCFRASGSGKIMTEPKEKSPADKYNECLESIEKTKKDLAACSATAAKTREKLIDKIAKLSLNKVYLEKEKDKIHLSDTCKKYLIDIYIQERTGRTKDIVSKYLDNGLAKEEASMSLLSEVDDEFYAKNKKRIFDDYNQGECDIFHNGEIVIDIKSSWDFWTFYKRIIEEIDDDYYCQAQVYMKLWGVKKYQLRYCLVDMPEELIDDEIKRLTWKIGTANVDSQIYKDGVQEIKANGFVSDIPKNERVITKYIDYDQDYIDKLHKRIGECRMWLNEFAQMEYYRVNNITPPAKVEIAAPTIEVEEQEEEIIISSPSVEIEIRESVVIEVEDNQSNEIEVEGDDEEIEIIHQSIPSVVEEITVTLSTEPIIIPSEAPPVFVPTGDILSDNLNKIKDLKTVEDCQKLYNEIKGHFELYPILKDQLVSKKRMISSQSQVEPEKPKAKAEPKAEAKANTAEKKQVIAENKELLEDLFKRTDLCKTDLEVKELYLENKVFIDANKKLKDYMQKIGEERELNPLLITPEPTSSGIVVEGEDISNL